MTVERSRPAPYALVTIGLVCCSMLMLEILLTRICALRLFFHFGFLVISNCLLAIGASGTVAFLLQERLRPRAREAVFGFTALYIVSVVLTYLFLISFRIRYDLNFSNRADVLRFTLFNLVAAVPLFFGGMVVSLLLTFFREHVNKVYAADLLGAGLACLLCPLFLWLFGAGGCVVIITLLGVVAAMSAAPPRAARRTALATGIVLLVGGAFLAPRLDKLLPVPGKNRLDFTDRMSQDIALPEYSQWSANSRVDLIPWKHEPWIFQRGTAALNMPLPEQKYILQDGSAGTFILNFSARPDLLPVLKRTSYACAVQLKEKPRVFIIGLGGGLDAWGAYISDASRIRAVELNRQIVGIHRNILPEWSRLLLEAPHVEFLVEEGRAALIRERDTYDVIQMSGIDTWTALTSGAYILAENYLYTREAVVTMYRRLAPDGMIQISRFAADMEALRVVSNVFAALESLGVGNIPASLALIKTPDNIMTTIVRKGPFTPEEISRLEAYAADSGLETIYLPGKPGDNIVSKFILAQDRAAFIREFPRDISPTTDDKPYFFNFTKWRNPLAARQHLWEPASASQGNPLFILSQLAFSAVLAALLIVLPLAIFRRRGARGAHAGRFFVYFAGLGAGFILIEIAVMQKFVLFLGHPLYSLTVTLFAMLVFTGLGSYLSEGWFGWLRTRPWVIPLAIAGGVFSVLLSPVVVEPLIGLPLWGRVLVAGVWLALLSLPLGVPFAYGVRLLNYHNPSFVPWAWAVNGCLSVIGSILTVVLSMNFGFNAVLIFAVGIYAVAFWAVRHLATQVPVAA
ncbi:MAG: hypothetical protein N2111_14520 [Candidatus Sumerlaeaceae bacterium]|nr:hypothetical protein [Candidatus Sumerlaeaceae bacterium]